MSLIMNCSWITFELCHVNDTIHYVTTMSWMYMWSGLQKGPLHVTLSQWQTRHVLLHVLGNIDCKWHYTPDQDSFFVFRWYTRSMETFVDIISHPTDSKIPLITVFANSLRQADSFRNQKPATNARYYYNIARRSNTSSSGSTFGSSEQRNENPCYEPDGTLRFPVWLSALISKNTVLFCAEPTFQLSESHGTKKYEKTYRQTDTTLRVFLSALISENLFSHIRAVFVD